MFRRNLAPIKVTRIGELGTTLAVTSNRRKLRRNTNTTTATTTTTTTTTTSSSSSSSSISINVLILSVYSQRASFASYG
jgi:hypothetical protein